MALNTLYRKVLFSLVPFVFMKQALQILLILALVPSCIVQDSHWAESEGRIHFELGAQEFLDGDTITIEEVYSTHGGYQEGTTLTVRGKYTLTSENHGKLYFGTTSISQEGTTTRVSEEQSCEIVAGSGSFTLVQRYSGSGYPHVSIYRDTGGKYIGRNYFGLGAALNR